MIYKQEKKQFINGIQGQNNGEFGMTSFEEELRCLINRKSIDSQSNTPDYILANYLLNCLYNYTQTVQSRDKWFGFEPFKDKKRLT